jgi:hypothetical protein
MNPYRIVIRLSEEPRMVELEIAAPLGTQSLDPVDSALTSCGVRAVGKIAFDTVNHSVFLARLVEGNHVPLDSDRIGEVLDVIRRNLDADALRNSRSLAA